jgi:hypothetical protein
MASWFTDLRKTALVALVTTILGGAYPAWNTIRPAMTLLGRFPWYLTLPLAVFSLFATLPFIFLFALYRSDATFRISKRLRSVALATAVVFGFDEALYISRWIRSFSHDQNAIDVIVSGLGLLSAVAYVLLLTAIFRYRDALNAAGNARLLLRVSQMTVVVWSLVLLGIVAGGVYLATQYPYFTDVAQQSGRTLPPLRQEILERLRILLQQAYVLVPPYIIYRSLRHMPASEPA